MLLLLLVVGVGGCWLCLMDMRIIRLLDVGSAGGSWRCVCREGGREGGRERGRGGGCGGLLLALPDGHEDYTTIRCGKCGGEAGDVYIRGGREGGSSRECA